MKRLITLTTLSILALSTRAADAQVPALLPVQGQLTDADDAPLTGDVEVEFGLYDVATGGAPFFSTTRTLTLADGTFAVNLGSEDTLDFAAFPASGEVYVGLTVGGDDELSPRVRVGTVPYAARAARCGEATTLQGAAADDFATFDHAHDYADLTGVPATFPPSAHGHAWSALTDVPAELADGDDDTLAQLVCADGQKPAFTGGGWACADDVDPVTAIATADAYVRNTGDAISGNLAINGSPNNGTQAALTLENGGPAIMRLDANDIDVTSAELRLNRISTNTVSTYGTLRARGDLQADGEATFSANAVFEGDVLMTGPVRVRSPFVVASGRPARGEIDRPAAHIIYNEGPTSGAASALPFAAAERAPYCEEFSGCTVVLIEGGHDAAQPGLRRSSGVHHLMIDPVSQVWVLDGGGAGRQGAYGGGQARAEILSVGRCAFAANQGLANGNTFDFAVTKEIADGAGINRVCTLVVRD
ncbi:MAG: hypothetical protein RIT81_10940 [Deltaproteobacteria bacterium]